MEPETKRARLMSWAGEHSRFVDTVDNAPSPSPVPYQGASHPFSRPADQQHHVPGPAPPQTGVPPGEERRHHEPERFAPITEHRQQPPPLPPPPQSPARPSFPPFRPREANIKTEPMVKGDAGEDVLPQLRRTYSTGGAPDDDKRHVGFETGPPPAIYSRQPSYAPPTPTALTQSSPFEYTPYAAQQGSEIYPLHNTSTGKKKAQRASQACDNCRSLKAKCDENKPCKSCKEKNIECKYREVVPKQQDKVAADILEGISLLRHEFAAFSQRLTVVEHKLDVRGPTDLDVHGRRHEHEDDGDHEGNNRFCGDMAEDMCSSPGEIVTAHMIRTQPPDMSSEEAQKIVRAMDEEAEQAPGPFVRPGNAAIPLNHTTSAARLMQLRSINNLVGRFLDKENIGYIEEFPLRQEERRGILRVWGRGEGHDAGRFDRNALQDQGMVEVRGDDDYYSESGGAPSPADCWGGIGVSPGAWDSRPPPCLMAAPPAPPTDFSPSAVWPLVRHYEKNMQNMHPLIPPRELHAMVKLFLNEIQPVARFVVDTVAKRKRTSCSPAPESEPAPPTPATKTTASSTATTATTATTTTTTRPVFQRTINNAVVLLVLGLGKMCSLKTRIPDVVPVSEPAASPSQGSPLPSASSGVPSPQDAASSSASRRPSLHTIGHVPSSRSPKRNMDVMPGLDYFAYATDILGAQLAGISLKHVWAFVLAGLYHGQMARVIESHAYIRQAGLALHTKMRPKMDRFRQMFRDFEETLQPSAQTPQENKILFAFWTILQLESDILAELALAPSPILHYEHVMTYPDHEVALQNGFEARVIQSYWTQLFMRKRLNQIHRSFYDPDKAHASGLPDQNDMDTMEEQLVTQLKLPSAFRFEQDDAPADELLAARLRAKLWGAQVITYRPFVRYVLECNANAEKPLPRDGRGPGGLYLQGARGYSMPQVLAFARKGIKALTESTRAFHGLGEERLIVTNIFGTANAQWGNLLTLAAVFNDPTLRPEIDEPTLRHLFVKTISMFRLNSSSSSSLLVNMRILENLESHLWPSAPASSTFTTSAANVHGTPPALSASPLMAAAETCQA